MLLEIPGTGTAPGTHALIVGVSHYPFADGPDATEQGEQLGLANLTSAARSASEVAAWLLEEYRNPDAPLASIRILLSPVEGELVHPSVAGLMGGAPAPATRDAVEVEFEDFRQACRSHTENVAFVYVAGHGIQLNKRGAVVLLHDFAVQNRNLLYGAIDIAGCRDAMDEAGNANRQIWFSDACRQRPEIAKRFESLAGAYRPDERIGQVKASPLFLASSTRESAFAQVGGTTIFSQAVLWALRGAAACGPDNTCDQWHVPTTNLIKLLPEQVKELLAEGSEEQHVDVAGRVLEVVVQRFDGPPDVDIEVDLVPNDATPIPVPELLFDATDPVPVDASWPLRVRGQAGLYQLKVRVSPPFTHDVTTLLDVDPPSFHKSVKVS